MGGGGYPPLAAFVLCLGRPGSAARPSFPRRKQAGGKVALAGIRQKGHHNFIAELRPAGKLHGRPQRRAGRDARQQPLVPRKAARGGKGLLCFHAQHLVVNAGVQHGGHKARANALNGVRPGLAAA